MTLSIFGISLKKKTGLQAAMRAKARNLEEWGKANFQTMASA